MIPRVILLYVAHSPTRVPIHTVPLRTAAVNDALPATYLTTYIYTRCDPQRTLDDDLNYTRCDLRLTLRLDPRLTLRRTRSANLRISAYGLNLYPAQSATYCTYQNASHSQLPTFRNSTWQFCTYVPQHSRFRAYGASSHATS